jgi:YHS domain-containing protein
MQEREPPAMAKDPMCGMDVDPQTASQRTEYQGQTYYFCAPGCRKAFEAEPQKYLDPSYRPHM